MAFAWIFCKVFTSKRFISTCVLIMVFILSVSSDGPSRPMLISLPINVRASMPVGPPPFYDLAESAEEQRLDERVIRRDNNDYSPNDFSPQDDNDNNFNSRTQPGFLSWNPGSNFMMLQLNDYIGAQTNDQEDQQENNSEEFEKAEDTRFKKRRQLPSDLLADFPEFEDYRRLMDSRRNRPSSYGKKSKASSLATESKLRYVDQSGEENDGGEVYGAEPVIHFVKESRRRKSASRKKFNNDNGQEESNGFNMRSWWGDY